MWGIASRAKWRLYVDAFRPEIVREPQGGFDQTREFGLPPRGSGAITLAEEIVDRIGKDVKGSNRKSMFYMATHPIALSKNHDPKKEAYVFRSLSGDPVSEIIAGKWERLSCPCKVMEAGHRPMITKTEEMAEDIM